MPLSDLYDDLDAFLCEPAEGTTSDVLDSPLMLDGQQSADRALRRLARVEREERNVRQVADAERDRIADWEADRLSGLRSRREWLERGLEGFMRALQAQTGSKSLSLPWGRLSLRKGATKVLADANRLPERYLKRPDPEPRKADIAKAAKPAPTPMDPQPEGVEVGYRAHLAVNVETGEVLVGAVILVPVEDSFTAKPTEVEE